MGVLAPTGRGGEIGDKGAVGSLPLRKSPGATVNMVAPGSCGAYFKKMIFAGVRSATTV